tara:strand:- start:155 stop:733 length:579 start_codon:yes stop_codon:yes gene_type:complete
MQPDFIQRYTDVYSKEECQRIIDEIEFLSNIGKLNKTTDQGSAGHIQDHLVFNFANELDYALENGCTVTRLLLNNLSTCLKHYLKMYSVLDRNSFLAYDCKVKKIAPGCGFHNWHYESGEYFTTGRKLVMQVYLNEEFEGGETEFLYYNKREKAETGSVLIFPCEFTHTHRGNPPIGGTKYLATTWAWLQND